MNSNPRHIRISDYNYPLPDERIAKFPIAQRDHSKLLVYQHGIVGEDVFSKPVRYRQIGVKTTCHKMPTMGYAKLAYDKDDYLVLPDYRHFYTRLMMDTETSAHMAAG